MTSGIPFEPQRNGPGRRRCAAAALTMIYRSFGRTADSGEIDAELVSGTPSIPTFHLARHALKRGLSALPCRLRDPWEFLRHAPGDIRVVLNHRIRPDSPLGHFTVFLELDPEKETVRIHDPQFGPDRSIEKAALLELWTPTGKNDEITGNVAVLFAERAGANPRICPRCGGAFDPFEPSVFRTVFCPRCDYAIPGRKA